MKHFNNILTTPRTPHTDNDQSNNLLDNLLKTMENDTFYITNTDIVNAINKLITNKSNDPFQIKAEHFTTITNNHHRTHNKDYK